jgi:hypothetical protein
MTRTILKSNIWKTSNFYCHPCNSIHMTKQLITSLHVDLMFKIWHMAFKNGNQKGDFCVMKWAPNHKMNTTVICYIINIFIRFYIFQISFLLLFVPVDISTVTQLIPNLISYLNTHIFVLIAFYVFDIAFQCSIIYFLIFSRVLHNCPVHNILINNTT